MGLFGLPIPNPLDILPSRQKKKKGITPAAVPVVVEDKVKAGAAGAGTGVVLAELLKPIVDKLPVNFFVKKLILLFLPIATSFIAGWLAPHTQRASI